MQVGASGPILNPTKIFTLEDQRPAEHLELLAEKLAAARTQQLPAPAIMGSLDRTTVRWAVARHRDSFSGVRTAARVG